MNIKQEYNSHILHVCSALDISRDDYKLFKRRGATIYLDNKPIERDAYNNAHCIY